MFIVIKLYHFKKRYFSVVCLILGLSFNLNSQIIKLSKKDSILLDSLEILSANKIDSGKNKEAIILSRKMEKFALSKGDIEKMFSARTDISFALFQQNKYEEALVHLDSTKQILSDLNISNSSIHYVNLFYTYGLIHKRKGRFKFALYFYERTIEHPSFNESYFWPGDVFENTARMISEQGDYQKSERYFNQAIIYIDSTEYITNRSISNRYKHTGRNYELWDKPNRAYEYYQLALKQLPLNTKDTTEIEQLISIYNYLADFFAKKNQFDEADDYLNKAKKLIFNNQQLLTYKKTLGFLKKQEGSTEAAIKVFEDALKLSKTIHGEIHTNHGRIYLNIGQLYAAEDKHHQALEAYQKSLINIVWNYNDSTLLNNLALLEINAPLELLQTLKLKATSLTAIGNLPKALETYELVANLIDLQCNHYLANDESRLFWIAKTKPFYEAAIDVACKLNQNETVFNFIQRGHGLLLLQSMQHLEAMYDAAIPDSLKKLDLSYKMSRSTIDSRLLTAQKASNQDKISKYETKKLKLEQEHEQFLDYLKEKFPQYAQLISTFPHKSIETIRQEVLTNKNALIEYFIGEENIYILMLTKDNLQIIKTHKNENFINQVNTFRQLIQDYDYSLHTYTQFCNIGFDLYETLLKQAVIQLPVSVKELIIIPDEQLNYIPFAAILDTPVDNSEASVDYYNLPYLLNKYVISYNYSSSLFGQIANEGNPNEVLGFAPSFGGAYSTTRNLDSLIYNTEEIQIIDSIIGGRMYYSNEATLAVFKENITRSNIVHLATHASVNDSLPMDSYIYFYNDSLPIHEIPNLQQNLNLAVLSACETGKGMLKKGEGIISLARAFIQSGCPSVVTSLWKVDDPKTPSLMKHFYVALKAGKKKNIALTTAQRNYMSEADGDSYAHPYYWATFIQVGDTAPLFINKKCSALLFGFFLLAAFIFFIIWKFTSKRRF